MSFDDAKANFFAAARYDLSSQLNWINGQSLSAARLIREHLLPLARQGLAAAEVAAVDVDKYLGIIDERVRSRQTGARWIVKTLAMIDKSSPQDLQYRELTARMLKEQKEGKPVHEWTVKQASESTEWFQSYQTVGQFMSTDLFTVGPDDLIDLAAGVMDWRRVRHIPVEDEHGQLVGVITHRDLLHLLACGTTSAANRPSTVREIMKEHPLTVSSTTPTLDALEIMQTSRVGCLPVVDDGQLVGIVTSYDFLAGAARLFRQHLTRATPKPPADQPAPSIARGASA